MMRFWAITLASILIVDAATGQSGGVGETEAKKCEERIATVERDLLNKYEVSLQELQSALQKSADLEGALAVRSERERVAKDQSLSDKDIVSMPNALRTLQSQTMTKMQELAAQLVSETVPKLVELKRQLTMSGKLDEALAVRGAIERLQNKYLALTALEPGATVPADAMITAYGADRVRSDKIYKGQKVVVRGVVGAFRKDPRDGKNYQVFLTGSSPAGWVQCDFSAADQRLREEKAYTILSLVITGKDGESIRVHKGSGLDIRGVCQGWDEAVHLTNCEIAR